MQNRLMKILNKKDVVLFVHSERIKEDDSFSKKTVNFLSNCNIDYKLVPVDKHKENELYKQLIVKTKWELLPQLFVKNEFIGGFFVIVEFVLSGELSRITKNKSYLPINSRNTNSNQNSIWRIKRVGTDKVLFSTANSNLIELKDGNEKQIINNLNNRWINCFALNTNLLYLGSSDSNIYTYNCSSKNIKIFISDHNRWINDIKLSTDFKYGYSVCGGGCILKWRANSGEIISKKQLTNQPIWSLDVSAHIILIGDNNGDIFVLDLGNNIIKVINNAHDACITKIYYCVTKDIWLSASYDTNIKIWSSNLSFINSFNQHSSRIWDMIYVKKNNVFVSISANKEIIIWDGDSYHSKEIYKTDILPVSVCYANESIIIGGVNGEVRKYKLKINRKN